MMNEQEVRMDERRKCWEAINAMVKRGPLRGNGCDESAQRNGIILAANLLAARMGEQDDQPKPEEQPT